MSDLLNPYRRCNRWFRGNIHTHTTASDGEDAPQAVVDWYAGRGYDFLTITDHNLVLDSAPLDPRGMVLVRGEELTHPRTHVVGLDLPGTLPAGDNTQHQIDLVRDAGGLAIVAHPNWMGLTVDDLMPLEGHLAMELSNQVCYRINGRGDSVPWWDALLTTGRRCWGVAVDDCHSVDLDAAHGWLLVAAEERSWPSIRQALETGSFVASTGPRISQIGSRGRTIDVECSPSTEVRFIGPEGRILHSSGPTGAGHLSEARFEAPESEPFVRVEIHDGAGGRAWSQPFWSA